MTDISVYNTSAQAENLSWDSTPPHGGFSINGVLDVTKFTAAQHYPNGYIPSGTVLGRVTATGLLAPYLGSAADGSNTAVGILKASVTVTQINGTVKAKVGCAARVHGVVVPGKLPFTSSNAAAGGYLDSAARSALNLIYFTA